MTRAFLLGTALACLPLAAAAEQHQSMDDSGMNYSAGLSYGPRPFFLISTVTAPWRRVESSWLPHSR